MPLEVSTDVREKEAISSWDGFLAGLGRERVGLEDRADPRRRRTLGRFENTLGYLRIWVAEVITKRGEESALDGSDRSVSRPLGTPREGGPRKCWGEGCSLRSRGPCGR